MARTIFRARSVLTASLLAAPAFCVFTGCSTPATAPAEVSQKNFGDGSATPVPDATTHKPPVDSGSDAHHADGANDGANDGTIADGRRGRRGTLHLDRRLQQRGVRARRGRGGAPARRGRRVFHPRSVHVPGRNLLGRCSERRRDGQGLRRKLPEVRRHEEMQSRQHGLRKRRMRRRHEGGRVRPRRRRCRIVHLPGPQLQ
jgi:hypothetical protein